MPEFEVILSESLRSQTDILENSQVRENIGDLEGTSDPKVDGAMNGLMRDVAAFEEHLSTGRLEIAA